MNEQKSYVLPLVGALLGTLLSGAIWGGIAIVTDYEVGYVALGTGALTGFIVALFAKKKVNAIHQLYAVLGSILGILLGKYVAISYFAKDMYGYEYLDAEVFTVYKESIFGGLEPMDYVFFLMAIVVAWQVTKSVGVKPKKQADEPSVPQ